MLPFRQSDIEDWPISLSELEPCYEAVQRFVPIAAERDGLCEELPLYTDAPGALRRGEQAERLLEHMRRHTRALKTAGFTFGASRLAVTVSAQSRHRCRYSGMCLYGCPYGSIYNAAQTLDVLRRDGRVDYRGGIFVDRLTEIDGSVTIDFHERRRPSTTGQIIASRVFVACGAISSTRLMLESTRHARHTCRMLDSQYFMIPMVTARAAPIGIAEQGNTLAQVFVELEGSHVSQHPVHLQIYGYNDIMLSALTRRLPQATTGLVERVSRPALARLVIIQGFLHSTDSPGLTIGYAGGRMRLVGDDLTVATARIRRLVRRLASHGRQLGMLPLPGLVHVGRPGKSNHLGGSLPMRREPGELQTDALGRLRSWKRVHVVDASVFPSLPATTVTLSAMANAHRIATAAVRLAD
jgi:choline dehydrogenase-like flavoprotein